MSGRARLEPKDYIPGEWNIILLHRYLPLSNGDRYKSKEEISDARQRAANARWNDVVQRAEELYTNGMTQTEIARAIGVSQATVNNWISSGFKRR